MRTRSALSLTVAGALLATAPAAAQVAVGADAAFLSSYTFRGVSYSNNFVIQPDAYVSFPVGGMSLALGAWANVEPTQYDGTSDISQGGGAASLDVTEIDLRGELRRSVGRATVSGGVVGYFYPNDVGFTDDVNTVEVYGRVALGLPLSPRLAVYYDLDKVKGAYLEGSVSYPVRLSPAFGIDFGAAAGVSAGQGFDDSSDDVARFADDGLTHLDLSASTSFALGPLSIAPTVHFLINGDDATKITEPGERSDTKVWFGATVSYGKVFGRR